MIGKTHFRWSRGVRRRARGFRQLL